MRKGTATRKTSAGEIVVCVCVSMRLYDWLACVRCVAVALFPCVSALLHYFSFSSLCDVIVLRFQCMAKGQMNVINRDIWCVLVFACVCLCVLVCVWVLVGLNPCPGAHTTHSTCSRPWTSSPRTKRTSSGRGFRHW